MVASYLIMILPMMAILSLLIYMPIFIWNKRRYGKRPMIRHLAIYVLIGVVTSILYLTIFIGGFDFTFHPGYHLLNLVPFIWIRQTYIMGAAKMFQQLVLNIVMFVPLGFILPIVFVSMRKWWKMILCVIAFILCIEAFQYFIGRAADVDDLIMNTLGAVIGYGLMKLGEKHFKNRAWWKAATQG
ncbi:MAG: VanZ family protein [Lachnospiraceae bacterium]|nr:VanZ family protein [Lachnospiraceae bacterium]